MNIGRRFLEMLFPEDERQRLELRRRIATSTANTEELNRTLTVSGNAILQALAKFRSDNDPQNIVEFDTFAIICVDRGRKEGEDQLCAHEKACEGQVCEQHACPVIVGQGQKRQDREVA